MNAPGLVEQIQALLEERLGLPVQVIGLPEDGAAAPSDALLRIGAPGDTRDLYLQAKTFPSSARITDLLRPRAGREGPAGASLLGAAEIPSRLRAELRRDSVNHADLAGNIFIREPGLYVWLEGDRKPPPKRIWRERPVNPFSKKASFVLRAMLEQPHHPWGIRELAKETGLSVGHASDVSAELIRRGYAQEEDGGVSLRDGVAALQDWTGTYNWSKNAVSSFIVPFESEELEPELKRVMKAAGLPFALTMLAGASRLAPHVHHNQTHLYVPPEQAERASEVVQTSLYGEPTAQGGTLHVMRPYYGDAAFYGAREVEGVRVVSPVQLFIDLADYPLRGAEAARMLALGPLAQQLGLDRGQVQNLTRTLE